MHGHCSSAHHSRSSGIASALTSSRSFSNTLGGIPTVHRRWHCSAKSSRQRSCGHALILLSITKTPVTHEPEREYVLRVPGVEPVRLSRTSVLVNRMNRSDNVSWLHSAARTTEWWTHIVVCRSVNAVRQHALDCRRAHQLLDLCPVCAPVEINSGWEPAVAVCVRSRCGARGGSLRRAATTAQAIRLAASSNLRHERRVGGPNGGAVSLDTLRRS